MARSTGLTVTINSLERFITEHLDSGYGLLFSSVEEASDYFGTPVVPAPLGNITKAVDGNSVKHRVIMDLTLNKVNSAASVPERQVLPTYLSHLRDLAILSEHPLEASESVEVLVLDYRNAFMQIPLAVEEQPFNCCSLDRAVRRTRASLFPGEAAEGFCIVWRVLGFGGRPNPLIFARCGSFLARTTQGLLRTSPASTLGLGSAAPGRLQLYVDDPVLTLVGSDRQRELAMDLVILYWLILGVPLSWSKGVVTSGGHLWIGAWFSVVAPGHAEAHLPHDFCAALFKELEVLAAGRGTTRKSCVLKMLGRCGRVAYIVPSARPFVNGLWGAFSAACQAASRSHRPEAPPGKLACVRFAWAASWLRELLRPGTQLQLFPLTHVYTVKEVPIDTASAQVFFDASPWGAGAALLLKGRWSSWFSLAWSAEVTAFFCAELGSSRFQTLWEYLALYLVLLSYASEFVAQGFGIVGDNIAALQCAVSLKGRKDLSAISREIAWRRVRLRWRYAVAHVPSEENFVADSLSRLCAPVSDCKDFPEELMGVPEQQLPDLLKHFPCSDHRDLRRSL